jgi:hypothetical protein
MTHGPDMSLIENDGGDDGGYPKGGSAFRGDDGVGFGFGGTGKSG